MNASTARQTIAGPAGAIDCAVDLPTARVSARGTAIVCHPHPQFGGTLDNKVVQTLARAFVQLGWRSVRFNYRGVGASEGSWDEGRGEVDDALAVIGAFALPGDATAAAAAASLSTASPLLSSTLSSAPLPSPPSPLLPSPSPLVPPFLLAGFSFGAFVAARAAERLAAGAKPQRLVLVGPSTRAQQMPAVPADTLVVHGEADEVVPLAATFDWARPQSLPVTVLPGVGHFFHGQLGLLKTIVVDALRDRAPL